jgi:hypothetical protein
MPAKRAEHYRKQAEDCRLQAERSSHIDHKESWLRLAAHWLHMAEEIDPTAKPDPNLKRRENVAINIVADLN